MEFSNSATFGGKALVDPRWVIKTLTEAGYNPSHVVGKANSMTLPRGFNPGLGWLLMQNLDYESLTKNSVHTLQLHSIGNPAIQKLVILGRESITSGPTLKDFSVVMVHIADVRHIGKYLSGYVTGTGCAANIHTPDYVPNLYYQASKVAYGIDSYIAPGWLELIDHLFSKIPPAVPRPSYTFSSFPEKGPEGFDFQGWSVWEALKNVLQSINHTLVLTIAGELHVAATGDGSTLPANALDTYSEFLYDDTMYAHNPSAYLGSSTVTHFEKFDFAFQLSADLAECTPKTYRRHRSIQSITGNNTFAAGSAFLGTYNHQQAALKALFEPDGTPVNYQDLYNEAQRQADQVSDKATKRTFHRIFKGWHNIPVIFDGFSSISWFDYGTGMNQLSDGGAFTEICILPFDPPPVPLITEDLPEYYSPGKHPGPPDLATPHIETEYLSVARPTQMAIIPRDARDTTFRYGELPDTGPQIITWKDSIHHTPFHNFSTGRIFLPSENYPAVWHQQIRKWLLMDGEQIVAVRVTEFLEPGRCANAVMGWPIDGIWQVGPACILQDGFHRNFLAPGEVIWAKPIGSTSDGVMVCETIGENGLQQVGKVVNNWIECGSNGLFNITVKTPDTNPDRAIPDLKISDKTAAAYYAQRKNLHTFGGCGFGQQTYQTNACPEAGTTRRLFSGEFAPLKYVPANRRWEYRPKPQYLFADGTLSEKMCQNGIFALTGVQVLGDLCTQLITIPNGQLGHDIYNLKAKSGDHVYIQYSGQSVDWWIVNVTHHTKTFIISLSPSGCSLAVLLQTVAAQICDDPVPDEIPFGTNIDVVTGVHNSGQCTGLEVDKANVCVMAVNGTSSNVTAITYESVIVVTDIYDDGENIVACFAEIFVPCLGDEWCEPVIPTETCESSGSGSG